MKVIIRQDGVVVDKSDKAEIVSNGIFMNGVIYGEPGLTVITTKEDPELQKQKYDGTRFVDNPDYEEPVDLPERVRQLEEENTTLKTQLAELAPLVEAMKTDSKG